MYLVVQVKLDDLTIDNRKSTIVNDNYLAFG